MIAWGEVKSNKNNYDLYFSSKSNAGWSAPIVISESPLPDILPALTVSKSGDVWVFWTQLEALSGKLKFCYRINGDWSEPEELFVDAFKTSMSPTALVDTNDNIWLAWAAVRDQDEDIYISQWKGTEWSEPIQVNWDNNTPDILPNLSLNSAGVPRLSWQGYSDGEYVIIAREWNGEIWESLEVPAEVSSKLFTLKSAQSKSSLQDLPSFIEDRSQLAIGYSQMEKEE